MSRDVVRHGKSSSPGVPSGFNRPRSLSNGCGTNAASAPLSLAEIIRITRSRARVSVEYSPRGSGLMISHRWLPARLKSGRYAASSSAVRSGSLLYERYAHGGRPVRGGWVGSRQFRPRWISWPYFSRACLISAIFRSSCGKLT